MSAQAQRERIELTKITQISDFQLEEVMNYHPWNEEKILKGNRVRSALSLALKVIIENVPPSADRSAAIRKLRECRMDCNSAITFNGEF